MRASPGGRFPEQPYPPISTTALTCCCPRTRRTGKDPIVETPTAWQQRWAERTHWTWCGSGGHPPVVGAIYSINLGHAPVVLPVSSLPLSAWPAVIDGPLAAVWAFSVIDRLPSPKRWFREVAKHLVPGGLLACSFAYWDSTGDDVAIGHELRERIYNLESWRELVREDLPAAGFARLGEADWTWRGAALGDQTIATVAAVRRA